MLNWILIKIGWFYAFHISFSMRSQASHTSREALSLFFWRDTKKWGTKSFLKSLILKAYCFCLCEGKEKSFLKSNIKLRVSLVGILSKHVSMLSQAEHTSCEAFLTSLVSLLRRRDTKQKIFVSFQKKRDNERKTVIIFCIQTFYFFPSQRNQLLSFFCIVSLVGFWRLLFF